MAARRGSRAALRSLPRSMACLLGLFYLLLADIVKNHSLRGEFEEKSSNSEKSFNHQQ